MKKANFFLFLFLSFIFGGFLAQIGMLEYLLADKMYQIILTLSYQHLYLVTISILPAIFIGVITGFIISRPKFIRFKPVVEYIFSLGQIIPLLALLAFSLFIFGIGSFSAIVVLCFLSLLPILRNATVGFLSVPKATIDAARGIGMSSKEIFFEVELPHSLGIILTGIRIAIILNISSASLGYVIGAGGLGNLIFTGLMMLDIKPMLVGIIITVFFSLAADKILSCIIKYSPANKGSLPNDTI